MSLGHRTVVSVLLLFTLILTGCGYRFAGNGTLPGAVKRVHVAMFGNQTAEIGLEAQVTDRLINALALSGDIRITDAASADAILKGRIVSLVVETASQAEAGTAARRRIVMHWHLELTAADGHLLWQQDDLSDSKEYDVVADDAVTEENRSQALAALTEKMAQAAYRNMSSGF